jgi:hypothetical protein
MTIGYLFSSGALRWKDVRLVSISTNFAIYLFRVYKIKCYPYQSKLKPDLKRLFEIHLFRSVQSRLKLKQNKQFSSSLYFNLNYIYQNICS